MGTGANTDTDTDSGTYINEGKYKNYYTPLNKGKHVHNEVGQTPCATHTNTASDTLATRHREAPTTDTSSISIVRSQNEWYFVDHLDFFWKQ